MTRNFFSVLSALILLSACSAPVHVQRDAGVNFSNYHTYTWVDTRANERDSAARANAYADISVRNAANEQLQKAGWQLVNSSARADVFISYDILIQRTRQNVSDPVYSQPFSRMFFNPYRGGWTTIYYPSQFVGYQDYTVPVKEGTITISITDAKTDKVVWQGWTSEQLDYSRLTPAEISTSVTNIFKKFKKG
jgi:hypothetical protein